MSPLSGVGAARMRDENELTRVKQVKEKVFMLGRALKSDDPLISVEGLRSCSM